MVQIKAKYDGKVLIPAEPLDVPAGTEFDLDARVAEASDALTRELRAADEDELAFMERVERGNPTPPGFVRRPGSAEGEFVVPDDFKDVPEEFAEYL